MRKLPDVIFVVDGAFEKQAVKEANTLKIPAYAVLNTNGDPDLVEAFIPANTNSVKSVDFIADALKKELTAVKPAKKGGTIKKIVDKKTTAKKTIKKEEK
jgi:small subunit ribosomal protein S2